MKRLYLILTLCSLAVILAPASGQDTKTGIVRGSARDTSPLQNPIEGVRVVVVNAAGIEHEALTDSSGEFEIIGLPPGGYLISFYKDGYGERVDRPITLAAGGEQYVMMKMSKMGTVRGSVSDTSPTPSPLEGVRVVIRGTDGIEHEAQTDSSGEFEITGLPSGRYLMSFTKEGYGERVGKPITVTAGGDQYVSMKMSEKSSFATFLKRLFGGGDDMPSKTTEEEESGSQNQESGSLVWLLLMGLVIVVGVVIISRRSRRRSE